MNRRQRLRHERAIAAMRQAGLRPPRARQLGEILGLWLSRVVDRVTADTEIPVTVTRIDDGHRRQRKPDSGEC